MVTFFYDALKTALLAAFPQVTNGMRLIDYDYGQFRMGRDGKPDKANYPALAMYIGVAPFEVRHTSDGRIWSDNFRFSITLVQHTAFDNDKRVLDSGLQHWTWVRDIVANVNKKMFQVSDAPSSGIVAGSPEDVCLTGIMVLESIEPEKMLGTQIITKLNFVCGLVISEILPIFVAATPTLLVEAEIVDTITPNAPTIPPLLSS